MDCTIHSIEDLQKVNPSCLGRFSLCRPYGFSSVLQDSMRVFQIITLLYVSILLKEILRDNGFLGFSFS
jgi:hypothetical protein